MDVNLDHHIQSPVQRLLDWLLGDAVIMVIDIRPLQQLVTRNHLPEIFLGGEVVVHIIGLVGPLRARGHRGSVFKGLT